MFDFHRNEDHVQIRHLNTAFRAPNDDALKNAIDLTFGNSILANLKIESEKDGKVLINMNKFLEYTFSNPSTVADWGDESGEKEKDEYSS